MNRGDEHLAMLDAAAEAGVMPLRSPCPAGCKFCYEYHMHRIFPAVKLARIPTFDDASFEHYAGRLEAAGQVAFPVSPVYFDEGTVHYSSMSDPFVQGLSDEQIIRLAANNDARGKRLYLSTPGNFLDPALAKRLTDLFPETFRLGLSVMTFDDELRPRLFAKHVDGARLEALVRVLHAPRLYMLNLGLERTLADLEAIRRAVEDRRERATVIITALQHNKLHSRDMHELAQEACDFGELAAYLVRNRSRYDGFADIFLHSPAAAFVLRFRNVLRHRLWRHAARPGDVVLTSVGAAPMLRELVVDEGIDVLPVTDSLGGTTTFTTTLTTTNAIAAIEGLLRERAHERPIGRIFMPSSIWWINHSHSLDGGTADDVRTAFPDLRFELVDIPMAMRRYRLTIDDAYAYHNLDVRRTRALRRPDQASRAALASCLDPGEAVTETGFIRRLDPLPGDSMRVSYFEALVEKSAEEPTPAGARRRSALVAGERRSVLRAPVFFARLTSRDEQQLFDALFVHSSSPAWLIERVPNAEARVRALVRRFAGVEAAAPTST